MDLNWLKTEASLLQMFGRVGLSKKVESQTSPPRAPDANHGTNHGFCVYPAKSPSCIGQSFLAVPMLEWECLLDAIVFQKYVTCIFILEELTVKKLHAVSEKTVILHI